MNKLSQTIIRVAKKLSEDGLSDRAKQFQKLAQELEQEDKIARTASSNLQTVAAKQPEPANIDTHELKRLFNKPLTNYKKFKE